MPKTQKNWPIAIVFLSLFSTSMPVAREAREIDGTRKERGSGFQEVMVLPGQIQCIGSNAETIPFSFTQERKTTMDKNFDPGESTMLLVDLSAREYEVYCPITNAKEQDGIEKDVMQKGTSVEEVAPARR